MKNALHLVKAGKALPLFSLGVLDEKGNLGATRTSKICRTSRKVTR